MADTYKLPNGNTVIGAWFAPDYRGAPMLWLCVSVRVGGYRIESFDCDEVPSPLTAMATGAMHLTSSVIAHAGRALVKRMKKEASDG